MAEEPSLTNKLRVAAAWARQANEPDKSAMLDEAADEIKRMHGVLQTIAARANDAKKMCEDGHPISAYNLASGILGQIGAFDRLKEAP